MAQNSTDDRQGVHQRIQHHQPSLSQCVIAEINGQGQLAVKEMKFLAYQGYRPIPLEVVEANISGA
jgi:hypothetical protein